MNLKKRYRKFLERFKIILFRTLFRLTLRTHAFNKGIFFIKGHINGSYLDYIKEAILSYVLKNPNKEIFILIDSQGGHVQPALYFYDFIKSLNIETTCIVVGKCFSAALTIFAVGKRKLALKHSQFFFHQMVQDIHIDDFCDKEKYFTIRMDEYNKTCEFVYELQQKEFGLDREVLTKLRRDGKEYDKKIFANEALELGVIHRIIEKFPFSF